MTIGSFEQTPKDLYENLETALTKVHEIFADNVRSLSLKTYKSQAVTFYMDLASSNTIRLVKGNPAADPNEIRYVEDEFDFLTNSSVRVYKDGTIRVVKRKKPEGEDGQEGEDTEMEKPDISEQKFIKSFNAAFAAGDHDWVRRKVNHMKVAKKGLKRLVGARKHHRRFFTKSKSGSKGTKAVVVPKAQSSTAK